MNWSQVNVGSTCVSTYMIKTFQVLQQEFKDHPWILGWQQAGYQLIFVDRAENISPHHPIICGADVTNWFVRRWLNQSQPAVYVNRGYVGNHTHKTKRLWRISVNGWANIKLQSIPYSRWHRMQLPRHIWKVKKVKNVLLAPSKIIRNTWDQETTLTWVAQIQNKFPGAEVRTRFKKPTPGERWADLWQDLDWADLVVSHSSAITCEAFWYGKKVISLQPCPTWAAQKTTLEDWDNPHEPEFRDHWHEHLAWSQFTVEEWHTGQALDLLQQYCGSILDYRCDHVYNLQYTEPE